MSQEIPIREIFAWLKARPMGVTLGLGILARVAQFAANRQGWMDEGALVANIKSLDPIRFFGPLVSTQLATPGFLTLEWLVGKVLGHGMTAMRLVPLVGGVIALFLFRALSREVLSAGAVLLAVLLFASADDAIYFSSEAKQYSTDLTIALACWLLGTRAETRRGLIALAGFGAVALWFAHPAVFVLAGVGLSGILSELRKRDWSQAGLWSLVGVAWLVSFAGVHAVAMEQLGHQTAMWAFWDFAFPPWPPRSVWDATWVPRRLLYFLINPLKFDAPFGASISPLPAAVLVILGGWLLARRNVRAFAMLILPVVFALVSSGLRLYPFHGRLVFFLIPVPLLMIAKALNALRPRRILFWCGVVMTIAIPVSIDAYHLLVPRDRIETHRHGDRRPGTLDPYRYPF
jgi:hypothetical protein